jgi:hypothetical protein
MGAKVRSRETDGCRRAGNGQAGVKLSRALDAAAKELDLPVGQLTAIASAVARQQSLPAARAGKPRPNKGTPVPAMREPVSPRPRRSPGPMTPVNAQDSVAAIAASRRLLTRAIDLLA